MKAQMDSLSGYYACGSCVTPSRIQIEDHGNIWVLSVFCREANPCGNNEFAQRLVGILNAAGKNRIFGPALVSVDADGSAWLQDPVKRDKGQGYRYASLTDLWEAWPDLRPVRWGQDEHGPFLIVEQVRPHADRD